MPIFDKTSGFPIPDLINIAGEDIDPADKITSFRAFILNCSLVFRTETPIADLLLIKIFSTSRLVRISKFLRP